MGMSQLLVYSSAGAGTGALVGAGLRRMLGRLRRGTKVPPGRLEVATGILYVVSVLRVGPGPALMPAVWVATLTVALSAVDLAHHRLPDAITLPALPLTFALLAVVAGRDPGAGELGRSVVCALAVGGLFLLLSWGGRAMGRGDVKLSPTIGAVLGFGSVTAVVVGIALAFVLGGVVGLVGMLSGRLTARSSIAFGPCLLLAAWLVLVVPALS